jgi:Flp pilus assembly protein TadD
MRRMLIGPVAVAMLLVAVAACSDGEGGGGGTSAAFCKDFKSLNNEFKDLDTNDDAALADAYRQLDELNPPKEISAEYHKIVGSAREAMATLQKIDPSDAEAVAKAQEKFAASRNEIQKASNKVDRFLKDECHIDSESLGG